MIDYRCPECGSRRIGHDAYAMWSLARQEFELGPTYDEMTCLDCGHSSGTGFEIELTKAEVKKILKGGRG